MTFLQILELARSTLTESIWMAVAALYLLHCIRHGPCINPKAHNNQDSSSRARSSRGSARSTSSASSDSSTTSRSSKTSTDSDDSNISYISVSSTTISIVNHNTNPPSLTLQRYIATYDYQFEADLGRMQGMQFLDPVTEMYLRRAYPNQYHG
ncbi:hypothetical protein TWF730_004541 [Orbilia blumenaviensis]|uniref:Uncharacterized protein n=1 Tax=Orbilia blumenaviensis TaxID=1796055 RepID=A0AAV9U174_9PEZI